MFWEDSLLELLYFEKFGIRSFWNYAELFIFKLPASGSDFQNTGLSPASAKLVVKYRLGRWNSGHLATLVTRPKEKSPS